MGFRAKQPTFASGEVDPSLFEREDNENVNAALFRARNVETVPQGGVRKRVGTQGMILVSTGESSGVIVPIEIGSTELYVGVFNSTEDRQNSLASTSPLTDHRADIGKSASFPPKNVATTRNPARVPYRLVPNWRYNKTPVAVSPSIMVIPVDEALSVTSTVKFSVVPSDRQKTTSPPPVAKLADALEKYDATVVSPKVAPRSVEV